MHSVTFKVFKITCTLHSEQFMCLFTCKVRNWFIGSVAKNKDINLVLMYRGTPTVNVTTEQHTIYHKATIICMSFIYASYARQYYVS